MRKKVNVHPVVPIYSLRTPITGVTYGIDLSEGDIAICIYARAKVEEILKNGTILNLNLTNFNKDNNLGIIQEVKEEAVVEVVKEEAAVEVKEVVKEEAAVEVKEEIVEEAAVEVKEEIVEEAAVEESFTERKNNYPSKKGKK